VTSIHDKEFIVAVIAYPNRYGIRILSEVPWKYWCGDPWGRTHLIDGDDPQTYHAKMVHDTPVKWEVPE
jgi:hypothetical protein